MSASLRHPIDLSASLYGTDSYSAREKKNKTSTPATETEALPYVLQKKKKAPANTLFIVLTSKAIWYTDVFL